MLPTEIFWSKLINISSFCLTTSVNSLYLNECYNFKCNKCSILSLLENCEKMRNIPNLSSNLESISVYESLGTIEN